MVLFNTRKRVLLLGNEGVTLYDPAEGGIERVITIAWQVPNFDQQLLAAFLRQNQGVPVQVLFDADHAYRKGDPIVSMSYFDRPLFLKRKLEAAFPNYPIRTYFEIDPEVLPGEDKPHPTYLYAAISETEQLDRIAAVLLNAGVPVAGVGLLPVESADLVTVLAGKLFNQKNRQSRWAVVIAQHETGGLRQVVVKDGRLALTRMTPVTDAGVSGAGWVEEVMREFKATLTYIARFGYTPAEGLDVIVIGGDAEKQFFDQQKFLPGSNFRCLKLSEALQLVRSRSVGLGNNNFGDALHAAWSSQKRSFAVSVTVPSIKRVMLPRLGSYIASLAMAAIFVCGTVALVVVYQSYAPLKEKYEQQTNQKGLLTAQYETKLKVFDAYPVKPNVVRSAMNVKNYLEQSNVNITPVLNKLRRSLDKDVKLSELTYAFVPAVKVDGDPSVGGAPATMTGETFILLSFKFDFAGNVILEQKVRRSAEVVEALKRNFPGFDVRLKSQFGNLSPTGSFSGEFGAGDGKKPAMQSATSGTAEIEIRGLPQ